MVQAGAVREKLMAARGGNGAASFVTGQKLAEAGTYLKSARTAVLNWTKEVYANSETVELHLVDVQEALQAADRLDDLRAKLEAKASKFGV